MPWERSHANPLSLKSICTSFRYFFFLFLWGFKGHLASFGQNKKGTWWPRGSLNRWPKRQIAGDLQRKCARILTSQPSHCAELSAEICVYVCYFFLVWSCSVDTCERWACVHSTRPSARWRSRSLPCTPPLPASCLDQWVTCMSNSPLEHTRRPARTRSKTHTYANTVIIFKVHSSTGMRFHVPLQKRTHMRISLRVPEWQTPRSALRYGF